MLEPGKDDRSRLRPEDLKIAPRIEKVVQRTAVDLKQSPGSLRDLVEVVESDHTQQFSRMYRGVAKKITELPDPFSQRRWRDDPAAAKSIQTVRLGQTAGNDEATEMKAGTGLQVEGHIKVDLVHQNPGTCFGSRLADLDQG